MPQVVFTSTVQLSDSGGGARMYMSSRYASVCSPWRSSVCRARRAGCKARENMAGIKLGQQQGCLGAAGGKAQLAAVRDP